LKTVGRDVGAAQLGEGAREGGGHARLRDAFAKGEAVRAFEEAPRHQRGVAAVPAQEAAPEQRGLRDRAREVVQRHRIEAGDGPSAGGEAAREFHSRRPGRHEEHEGTRTHRRIISGGMDRAGAFDRGSARL
jgi:hypothetical protein